MKRVLCTILSALMILSLAGCGAGSTGTGNTVVSPGGKTEDLMAQITARQVDVPEHVGGGEAMTDFAVRLFQAASEKEKNTLISPLSVVYALAMTANGARGETLAQMKETLGMDVGGDWNETLNALRLSLDRQKDSRLDMANSIWFTEDSRFTPEQDFLQCNADYYGADIYRSPFDDSTLKAINNWVKEKTHDMIPEILDRIPEEADMYLVNALAFEAEWDEPYDEFSVQEGKFTLSDGTEKDVNFLWSSESAFLPDGNARGFIKYYKGGRYAFTALLPDEGVSLEDYVASLTGERLYQLLSRPESISVIAAVPKFEAEYATELAVALQTLGMKDAFDRDLADFSALGHSENGNLYIGRVLHKTFISVGEKGTRAGAATVVEMPEATSAEPEPVPEPERVILDRPFVYMLVDLETGAPFFIGTMLDPAA